MNTKYMKFIGIRITIFLCITAIVVGFSMLFSSKPAYADPTSQKEIFLPTSEIENAQLYPVVDFSYFNGNYGIIQKESAEKNIVSFFTNYGAFTLDEADVQNADKISFINENLAVVLSKNILYKVDISSSTVIPLEYGQTLTGNTFDLNNNYLATLTGEENNGSIDVYSISGTSLSYLTSVKGPQANKPISGKKPVAINNQNVFFVISNTICYRPLNGSIAQPIELTNASPSKMIASDEFLFFIENGKIFKIDLSTCDKTELSLNETLYDNYSDYELGNFKETYSSIFFKNENLLISDGTETVQEFRVNGDKLEFTGFAIAKDKTAYNRISANAEKIERYGKYVVVKDENKLSVIKNERGFDGKDQKYFKNFFDLTFDKYCVGDGVILLANGNKVSALNIENQTETTSITFDGSIKDLSYRNGNFYVATSNGEDSFVYCVSSDCSSLKLVKTYEDKIIKLYALDQANVSYAIFSDRKLFVENEHLLSFDENEEPSEIQVDLDGTIYLLINNELKCVNKNNELVTVHGEDIKSFALSFDKSQVFFLKKSDEFIYTTKSINNHSIEGTKIPSDYKFTDSETDVQKLATCIVDVDASMFFINDDKENFGFICEDSPTEQYLFICNIEVGDTILSALAGQDGIVLTYEKFVTKNQVEFFNAPQVTYITTGVNVYYLPIITMDNKFALTDSGESIRLEKGTRITPIKSFSAINRDYYYAEIVVNEKTYKGYIPKEFTVDVLSEDKTSVNFTLKKVTDTSVYLDKDLQTEIATLKDGEVIRLVETSEGIAEIYFESEGLWIKGYINADSIYKEKDNSIRNAIMLLIAVTCACTTIIYFMFRKKS